MALNRCWDVLILASMALFTTAAHSSPDSDIMVIAHRGASAVYPDHSLPAYTHALMVGADSIECDVTRSRDGVMLCRHDLVLDFSTDVLQHPALAGRTRTRRIPPGAAVGEGLPGPEPEEQSGVFIADLSWAEIQTLSVRQPMAFRDHALDGGAAGGVLRVEDFLALVAAHNRREVKAGRPTASVYMETKVRPGRILAGGGTINICVYGL